MSKICLVCSAGGHLTETLQILDAFQGHELCFATYHSTRSEAISDIATTWFTDNIGRSPLRMFKATWWSLGVLRRERPDLIVSLGSEIALPFFWWAWLMRIPTIYIESWCRTESLSLTGRLIYPLATQFWVQWPQLLPRCGRKARFCGAVI